MLKGWSAYFASELMCMDYITTSVRTVQDLILFAEPRPHLHFLPSYWLLASDKNIFVPGTYKRTDSVPIRFNVDNDIDSVHWFAASTVRSLLFSLIEFSIGHHTIYCDVYFLKTIPSLFLIPF
jgi:hypothetical protein